jgi:hypothetical protein
VVGAVAGLLVAPAAHAAAKPKWTALSGNVKYTLETPSIAKFGSGYEVIWVAKPGSTYSIQARILNAAGKPSGGVITVVKGWAAIQNDPTILADGSKRIVAFGGNRNNTATYDGEAEYYLTSSNGTKWTLSTGSLTASDDVVHDTGTAVINDVGTLTTGLAKQSGVTFHAGASASNPAPGTDKHTSSSGLFPADPGLAADAKSHAVWAVWSSGDGGAHKDGVWAQPILPSLGTLSRAPGSSTANGTAATGVQQDLSAAARAAGGVYTAYATPADHSIDVWKLGAKKPTATIKDSTGVSSIVVAAAPKGRLWVYWRDGQGWRATRSNKAASRFGPITSIPIPHNDSPNIGIAGYGGSGPLEAIGTLTTAANSNEVVARQILPRLSVKATPHAVKRGHSFTVRVTDAGDAVKGAVVHFAGHKKKTNAKGKVKIKVKHGTSLGKHAVTFTASGYAAASTKVTVKK